MYNGVKDKTLICVIPSQLFSGEESGCVKARLAHSQIPPKVGMTRISFCIRKFVFYSLPIVRQVR